MLFIQIVFTQAIVIQYIYVEINKKIQDIQMFQPWLYLRLLSPLRTSRALSTKIIAHKANLEK